MPSLLWPESPCVFISNFGVAANYPAMSHSTLESSNVTPAATMPKCSADLRHCFLLAFSVTIGLSMQYLRLLKRNSR